MRLDRSPVRTKAPDEKRTSGLTATLYEPV
jgi:hypothetical protein